MRTNKELSFVFLADQEPNGMWNGRIPGIGGQSVGYCTSASSLEDLLDKATELCDLWVIDCWENNSSPEQKQDVKESEAFPETLTVYTVTPSLKVEAAWMLQQLRLGRKMSQEEAARLCKMSVEAYAHLESPLESKATRATLRRISKAFGEKLEFAISA